MVQATSEDDVPKCDHRPSPLEAMAKGYWSGWDDGETFEDLDCATQNSIKRNMRAAVLALAECELPREVLKDGFRIWAASGDIEDSCAALQHTVRAMLRSIASEPG